MKGQRKFKRLSLSRSCYVISNGFLINGSTADLSASGCSLALDSNVQLTERSKVQLVINAEEISVDGLVIDMSVAWVRGCMIGCEFMFPNDKVKIAYYKLLGYLNENE
ncbi:PilZ domain-containing protein [Vibrio sp. D431a]|uniref:PilZ domain-containing protein n=1 Tax=Vibrio sp. D431a TaxID=2837388 RepID=UPI0025565C03|nr:PilZ domain-containing protein [Vibrio sp. D431a]MDK9793846.1 PilZ domain-containing protein [Vibrio sp. D431a]